MPLLHLAADVMFCFRCGADMLLSIVLARVGSTPRCMSLSFALFIDLLRALKDENLLLELPALAELD